MKVIMMAVSTLDTAPVQKTSGGKRPHKCISQCGVLGAPAAIIGADNCQYFVEVPVTGGYTCAQPSATAEHPGGGTGGRQGNWQAFQQPKNTEANCVVWETGKETNPENPTH